ncbi:MAG: SRPBCC family protein [Steroidobacteraceae bacterium]|jgi:uncharacterized protein YndB with AHSA1/START domain
MATAKLKTQTGPLVVSRVYPAARELVFRAWSSADHVKRWFCPSGYSVPEAAVDFFIGGAFDICMRSPEGHDHWTKGRFAEITPHSRLVIDMNVVGDQDKPLFRAHTVATFADVAGGTRLEVTQTYTLIESSAAPMIAGAPRGWSQTLDRLEQEVARIQKAAPGGRAA